MLLCIFICVYLYQMFYCLYHFAFIISLSEVSFLLFRSVFICSICKFVREFAVALDGFKHCVHCVHTVHSAHSSRPSSTQPQPSQPVQNTICGSAHSCSPDDGHKDARNMLR